MTERVTAYLCCIRPEAVVTEGPSDRVALTVSSAQVLVKIWPDAPAPGCIASAGKITPQMNQTSENPYCAEVLPAGALSYYRNFIVDGVVDDFLTVEVDNPEDCHWDLSIVWFFTGTSYSGIWQYCEPSGAGDPIPTAIGKNAAFPPAGVKCIFRGRLYAKEVPGGRFVFNWRFSDSTGVYFTGQESPFYRLTCFFGGTVAVVNGTPGTTTVTYDVTAGGSTLSAVQPSDLSEYEVGDWVFLATPDTTNCRTCAREPSLAMPPNELGGKHLIIPYRINGVGPS